MVCSVCGRKLKSTTSIEAGCGPICYQKMYGISLKQHKVLKKVRNIQDKDSLCHGIPGQMDIKSYLQELNAK